MLHHKFIRYGTLDLKKQKGFTQNPETFHSPPCSRGIYAFPIKAVELFLLGGDYGGVSFEEKKKKRKEFTHNGNLWHHLGDYCKPVDVQARHGSWVKTTVGVWAKAFSKQSLKKRYGDGSKYFTAKSINEPTRSGVSGMYSKDDLEVFFDEKVT